MFTLGLDICSALQPFYINKNCVLMSFVSRPLGHWCTPCTAFVLKQIFSVARLSSKLDKFYYNFRKTDDRPDSPNVLATKS